MDKLTHYFMMQGFNETMALRIAESFSVMEYKKDSYFAEEGKISKYLGFVEKGFLQYYLIVDGIEKTTYSVGENSFITSLVSFLKGTPARENIRAVMDTTIWIIEKNVLTQLLQGVSAFKDFYIGMLEWQICCIDESRLDAIVLSATERYEKMMLKEPNLIQQIPLQYLASILGITPRHLSRIRNRIRK